MPIEYATHPCIVPARFEGVQLDDIEIQQEGNAFARVKDSEMNRQADGSSRDGRGSFSLQRKMGSSCVHQEGRRMMHAAMNLPGGRWT
ncbi:hypothetical protein W02_22360 [Nitrospira sp. KM1]|nr:hypothetical protein W02_22360 [Nitrospira sp. KM1]